VFTHYPIQRIEATTQPDNDAEHLRRCTAADLSSLRPSSPVAAAVIMVVPLLVVYLIF
jgi:hypothetical protein